MKMNAKLVSALGLLVLAAVVLVAYFQFIERESVPSNVLTSKNSPVVNPVALPSVSGDLGAAVTALSNDLLEEQSAIAAEESDVSFITSDSEQISDFGNAYQPNDF